MLSQKALETILGIEENVSTTPESMAEFLRVTFFPYKESSLSKEVRSFLQDLEVALKELKVTVIPYEESLHTIPLHKTIKRFFSIILNNALYSIKKILGQRTERIYINWAVLKNLLKRRRIKPGIAIIAAGEQAEGKLPIDFTSSFTKTLVTTVLDKPKHINTSTAFHDHFDTAMELFARHMTNVVIAVDETSWTLYNFNASHPTYPRKENFKNNILSSFISKAAAPMRPQRLKDFEIKKEQFNIRTPFYNDLVTDFLESGKILEKIGLYPKGKKIDDLPFRNNYYKWIGKIHLDQRSGMSYGFLAWQMPTKLSEVNLFSEISEELKELLHDSDFAFDKNNDLYIKVETPDKEAYVMKVPEVQVLTQRSGCDKTNFDPQKDLLQMGIKNGKMYMQTPEGMRIAKDYKPSFDTKVILAHSVGNAIAASLLKRLKKESHFAEQVEHSGIALSHWHGYINEKYIPKGWYVHGYSNPHVACSTPQSAIYAIDGKLRSLFESLKTSQTEFLGDIHVEPHHGTNINFPSLRELAKFFQENKDVVALGNKYYQG